MATITQTTNNGNQVLDVAMGTDTSITLATAGTYVDKNIVINMAKQIYDAGQKMITTVTDSETGTTSTKTGQIFNEYSGANKNQATANDAHAEGRKTTASNTAAHAEGYNNTASGIYSHAEGTSTTASGSYSHAEGWNNTASNNAAHVEGYNNTASGLYCHAQGANGTVSNSYAHIEGNGSLSGNNSQHVQGQYNVQTAGMAHIVGWGTNNDNRKNIHTVSVNGNAWFQGDVYVGSTGGVNQDSGSKKLATEEYVNTRANQTVYTYNAANQELQVSFVGGVLLSSQEVGF